MASSSASCVQKSFKYDVFLSFRGEDTRKSFVDHLYLALDNKGIITYKDDERIQKGERISDQLIRSIQDSRFYIIVFSKNYASSSWCLDELVKIMECQKMTEHTAYPVFFDVEPTEVRNQSGSVGEAFAKHVEKEGAGRWRDALKEVAGLAGWELKNTLDGHEAKFIQKIVVDISLKLSFINWRVDEDLVGMESRVEKIVSSLEIGSEDVRMIGIWGMGGGGKTTLATAVYERISVWFEGKSFVENVREVSKGSLSGLKKLQKQVLKDVSNDPNIDVTSIFDGKNKMKKMMGTRKVLVVLDDVDDIGQLDALAGKLNWFKPGSRIIITTRDEQVLVAHGVHSDYIHDARLLSNEEAICLFSRYAFKREIPNQGYEELSRKVIHYAAGLPLTIKVLGSFLCGRIEREWVDAIERLKTIPLKETLEKLELSYNGLENDQKEIFLEVVCILKGETINRAIRVLESCGFNAQIGLRVLEQKSLINISYNMYLDKHMHDHVYLGMHDHIEEMGQNIVRRLYPNEPSKHSRLWIKKEIEDILVNDLGTEATRSMKLQDGDLHPVTIINGLRKMEKLRYLYMDNGYDRAWKVDEAPHYLPDALQYLYWSDYNFCWLPKTFQANELVNLDMRGSNISELWEGGERKVLNKMRFLNLEFSKLRTFDLGITPRLEELNLRDCEDFVELHLPVECPNLKSLDLSSSKLRTFDLRLTPRLEKLNLEGCNEFVELYLPFEYSNLKSLDLSGSKLRTFDLRLTPRLEKLNLASCIHFVELHFPVECPNLKSLKLTGSKVSNLNLGITPHLGDLDLGGCYRLQEVHAPVGCLNKLVYLNLSCLRFEYFLVNKGYGGSRGLGSLATLELSAKSVDICRLHPNSILPKFQFKCKYEETLPSLSGNLEKLISLGLCACTNLESFSASICGLRRLRKLTLDGSFPEVPKDQWQSESLEKLSLCMKMIKYIPDSICMLKHLISLDLNSCWLLEQLPENICRLECLQELHLGDCISLRDIPNSICNMKCLIRLSLPYCILVEKLPEELGSLKGLRELNIDGAGISCLPRSILEFKGIKIIGSRWQLESYGFTSLKRFPLHKPFYYTEL